jgi:hypothetical protein
LINNKKKILVKIWKWGRKFDNKHFVIKVFDNKNSQKKFKTKEVVKQKKFNLNERLNFFKIYY